MQVISQIQRNILIYFGDILESDQFYLTGGTALAHFYLRHRKSNDLDFFTATEELVVPFSHRLEKLLEMKGMSVQRQRGLRSFVEFFVKQDNETTIVQLAQDAAFRFEQPKEFPEYPKLKVDNLLDIASNKLLALFSRAVLRDFIDIYFLIQKGYFTSDELMDKAKVKDPGFDLYWLAVAFERIKTFDNASAEMLLLLEPLDFHQLTLFFNQWRQEIVKKLT